MSEQKYYIFNINENLVLVVLSCCDTEKIKNTNKFENDWLYINLYDFRKWLIRGILIWLRPSQKQRDSNFG